MNTLAKITPKVIVWARETAKMTKGVAASKMSISEKKLEDWENGIRFPTIKQAQKLAKLYRRPFAIFFFPDLPEDFHPLRDFRRKNSIPLQTASVFIIREVQQKQVWMRDNLIENNQTPLQYVGRFSLKDSPEIVAKNILETIKIDPTKYTKIPSPLNQWITSVENIGINVSRTSFIHSTLLLDPDELQGFAIVDQYAPFIFINSKDWESSQLFTLVHELAHIWIGESGISNEINSIQEKQLEKKVDPIEVFCSCVSANVLMPKEFMKSINDCCSNAIDDLYKKSKNLGVSSFAYLYRLLTLGIITRNDYFTSKAELERSFNDYLEKEKNKPRQTMKSPVYYPLLINKNGKLFIQTVLNAYKGGEIEISQASYLLNIKANNLNKLEEKAFR